MNPTLQIAISLADKAKKFLLKSGKPTLILVEGNRNQGDVLHHTVILHHYRTIYPEACIVFIVGDVYYNAHEFNPHADKIMAIPVMEPKERIALRKHLLTFEADGIKIIAPSIHPYRAVWKELEWTLPNIADQYLKNAGIKELACPKRLIVKITKDDEEWADSFLRRNKLKSNATFGFEFKSYSRTPIWPPANYEKMVYKLKSKGINCICFCGLKERPIRYSISGAGVTWRQTVALLNRIPVFIGCGSGVTMLAAAAKNQPKIVEICIPDSTSMQGCGYAKSIPLKNIDPVLAGDYLYHQVLHQS